MYKTTPQPKSDRKPEPKLVDRHIVEELFREALHDSKKHNMVDTFDAMFPDIETYAKFFNYVLV